MHEGNAKKVGVKPTVVLWTSAYRRSLVADFCIFGGAHALLPIIPLYVYSLEASDITVGITAGVFMGVAVFLRPFTGWLVDAYGRRLLLIVSALLFAVAGLGLPLWPAILPLIVFRMLQGIAWSAVVTASTTLQADVIPAARRGEGIGYVSSARNLSTAIAPAAALFIASNLDITYAVWFVVMIGIAGAFTTFFIREAYVRPTSLPSFRWWQLVEKSAIAPAFVSASMMFVFGGIVTFIPLDAQRRTIGDPAMFFLVFSLLLMVIRPLAGKWSDRISNRGIIIIPGLLSIAAAVAVLAMLENTWTLIIVGTLWALGFGCIQPLVRTLVLERSPPERWGAANATLLTFMDVGLALGPLILGYVASNWNYPIMYTASAFPLLICVASMLLGIFQPWKTQK
ncbi:MFS transporter [Alphaproteobacteria bacterium]|nr:MFS transporter [Alphaproteobacteria bacterium]